MTEFEYIELMKFWFKHPGAFVSSVNKRDNKLSLVLSSSENVEPRSKFHIDIPFTPDETCPHTKGEEKDGILTCGACHATNDIFCGRIKPWKSGK